MTQYAPIPRPQPNPAHVSITMRLSDPSSDLLVRHVRLLRDCVALAQRRWGFGIDAAVVLPSEMHLLCGFPDAEFGVVGAIKLVQSAFVRHLPGGQGDPWADETELLEISPPAVALRRRFIEAAPVRAGHVPNAADWPYSSAHRDVAQSHPLGVAVA